MGIEPGSYKYAVSGWKAPCCKYFVRDHEIGLIVKTSGMIPEPCLRQKPDEQDYAWDEDAECQPVIILFPIKHALYSDGLLDLIGFMRFCWEGDRTVLFHCNNGEARAPVAAAVALGVATGKPAIDWLPYIFARRNILKEGSVQRTAL